MLGKVLILAWGVSWPMAAAAPWVQEAEGLYTRVSVAQEEVEGLSGWRWDAYSEYGLTSKWTITSKLEHVDYPDASDFSADGWRATLRYKVFERGSIKMSLESGLLEGAAIGGSNGCHKLGLEIRSGLAWSGKRQKRETFMFGEVAGRFHEGCERERYEFGIGQQTSKNVWSVTQIWLERGNTNANSDKFQSEILWRRKSADVSFGYRIENGGLFEEESVFVALARQF